ncbi:Osteopetrosis-associated transmembrane protein 1 precursor [Cinara cedri]|uniref:Osteopetrosis-associated transmembrane protein 1 n=1 Tax=Cinara cedri TaxID=506608 RepID=A0A5E4NIF5_9HEMI|nr:Osteopetrosis-associated transmembrane protein 1 precursor [Cinara cedri]
MAKIIYLLYFYLFYFNTCFSLQSTDTKSIDVLPDVCENRLQLFANETANFTLCVITNARPITVCENCANEYYRVLERYEAIQKLHVNDSEVDCRIFLTNIDRLQVVYASYNYVLDMWEKASCKLCLNLNGTLNDKTKYIMHLGDVLDSCVTKHIINGTNHSSSLCTDCKEAYMTLNSYYITHKIDNVFCMDVVDLINNTQTEWSLKWKCHVSNYDSEWVLLFISFIVLLLPVMFYFINWLFSQERSNTLIFQNRWHERFTNNAASTSNYVVIT